MYTLNGWWFLSSGGSYPPVFTVVFLGIFDSIVQFVLGRRSSARQEETSKISVVVVCLLSVVSYRKDRRIRTGECTLIF